MTSLSVRDLTKHYPLRGFLGGERGVVRALDGVNLELGPRETLGIVGESGSGKTTLGRCLLRLVEPTRGAVLLDGEDLLRLGARELRARRRLIQMIFQDPFGSLDPRQRVGSILEEPLQIHRLGDAASRRARVLELLDLVGLPAEASRRYPHEFSGGQRQRIGIARALATGPRIVVADEPVSALDVSVRAQILNLMAGIQQRLGLSMIFIGHDLGVVEQVADRVAVMYLGKIVEEGLCTDVLARPLHPYTESLLAAVPPPPGSTVLARSAPRGETPDPAAPPPGCPFHPRCPRAQRVCSLEVPALVERAPGRLAACHFPAQSVV
ncbi:MAG: oligopeptide/dipeptide ABC transporter ATP-binding protein [Acidobacteriota bacterium]